jgi:hypothetical protein
MFAILFNIYFLIAPGIVNLSALEITVPWTLDWLQTSLMVNINKNISMEVFTTWLILL